VLGDKEDTAAGGKSEARPEELDERQLNLTQGDGFNFHRKSKMLLTRYSGFGN
jgi:hypothetical protein